VSFQTQPDRGQRSCGLESLARWLFLGQQTALYNEGKNRFLLDQSDDKFLLLLCTRKNGITIWKGSYRTKKRELPLFVCTMWTVLVIVETKAFIGIYDFQDLCEYCPQLCSILLEFYHWLCAIAKRWWPIFKQSFKFAEVLWLLEWSSCEKLCLVGKINQYASEWQQRLFECVIF
jgi:hypothetical protein